MTSTSTGIQQAASEAKSTMAMGRHRPASPRTPQLFARLSRPAILLGLLLAGQGCGHQSAKIYARGVEAMHRQDYDLAIAEFTQVIQLKPKYAGAYNNRGVSYAHKGDYGDAITDFNKAIRLNPGYVEAYYNKGIAYNLKGDSDEGIADFTEAIRLNPSYTEAYYNRAIAYHLKGDSDRAIVDFAKAIRLKPDYAEAYKGLAWLLAVGPNARARDGAKAVEYATRACAMSAWKIPAYVDTLAAACAEAGNFDDAVKWETQYLESNPPKDVSDKARQRLSLYQQKTPYHEQKP
jgi:tetratricopeptide (TPR) repeat protein